MFTHSLFQPKVYKPDIASAVYKPDFASAVANEAVRRVQTQSVRRVKSFNKVYCFSWTLHRTNFLHG